ncbi:hypothetical protein M3Y94_00494200 [Aphelenchoides besseyi]|nr:hypothetical protein M3Y94_00494200 [Aphelenchoides besseyi]KAI6217142.1 hypothetical protein M3Y95_01237300 [Aphelenchoides besseyi]
MNSATGETQETYVYEHRNLYPLEFKRSFSAVSGELDETVEGGRLAVAQPSQYHFEELRNFPAYIRQEDHHLFDRSVQSTSIQNAQDYGILTRDELQRVQQLPLGYYRAVVVDGQLHFIRADDNQTANGHSELAVQTARSMTNTEDCATARSIGEDQQFATVGQVQQLDSKLTVEQVFNFLSQPGAREALAEYEKQVNAEKDRLAAEKSEAELRQNLNELEHAANEHLSPRPASETEHPFEVLQHKLQQSPSNFDPRAVEAAQQLDSSLANCLLTDDPEVQTARSLESESHFDQQELMQLRTALDEMSSKDVVTARLPEDEEVIEFLMRTARTVESDVDTESDDIRTAVAVGSNTEN